MNVFVAGGTGVLGRRAVPALVAAGHRVVVNTRDSVAAERVRTQEAEAAEVDLFDRVAVAGAIEGMDAVVNLTTAIPTGARSARRSAWATNDRLRREVSANLAAGLRGGGRYVGESIVLPYVDRGDEWIEETVARDHSWATESVQDAEAAARSVDGVVLRFAMFWAEDSAHHEMVMGAARRGVFALPGRPEAFVSWIHVDDAAAAVVAALRAPVGTYNVAEPDPTTRGAHATALAAALGRSRLRHLPAVVVRLGGAPVAALARSHRISSGSLAAVTDWRPQRSIVECW